MYNRKKLTTEMLFCGIYIDSDGFAICLIDSLNFQSQGFRIQEVYFTDTINLGNLNALINALETTKNIYKFGVNKPFNKQIIESKETVEDIDFDLFNGLIQLKSMINDNSLKIDKNTEIYDLLKNYEKDTVCHRVFSLVVAVSLLVNNINTLRWWTYWGNYKPEFEFERSAE